MQKLLDILPRIFTLTPEHLIALIALVAMLVCGFALYVVLSVVT